MGQVLELDVARHHQKVKANQISRMGNQSFWLLIFDIWGCHMIWLSALLICHALSDDHVKRNTKPWWLVGWFTTSGSSEPSRFIE